MRKDIDSKFGKSLAKQRRKKTYIRVLTILASIAVFITTYALIIPAITWDRTLICEIPEHKHTEACYETVTGGETKTLNCAAEEHTHSEACYEERDVLVCTLEEGEEHTHTEECYEKQNVLACEKEEHTHTDACYTVEQGEETTVLTCKLQEHEHSDACFDAPPAYDAGYVCKKIEHIHNEYCYFADGSLRCTIAEHTHTKSCMPASMTKSLNTAVNSGVLGASGGTETAAKNGATAYNEVDGTYWSDPTTSLLENTMNQGGAENNGKIMTDKSVTYGTDQFGAIRNYEENEFGVALSAIGQGYDLTVAYEVRAPMDVVYVLDVSASMLRNDLDDESIDTATEGENSRAAAMITALNTAIDNVVKDNPLNRVGVVLFSEEGHEFMPLGRYKTSDGSATYVTIGDFSNDGNTYAHINSGSKLQRYNDNTGRYENVTLTQYQGDYQSNVGTSYRPQYVTSWGGTYTQAGIETGANMLLGGADQREVDIIIPVDIGGGATVDVEKTVARKPVMVLLTDGVPTYYSTNIEHPTSSTRQSNGTEGTTRTNNGTTYASTTQDEAQNIAYGALYGMRTAKALKAKITQAYSVDGASNNTIFYTLGMGYFSKSDQNSFVKMFLDPNSENFENLQNTQRVRAWTNSSYYNYYYGYQLRSQLNKDTSFTANHDFYDYADGSQVQRFDADQLSAALTSFITSDATSHLYGIILQSLTRVEITDTIGDGMEMKGDPVLVLGGNTYSNPKKVVNGNITTYTYDDPAITVTDKNGNVSAVTATVTTDPTTGKQSVKMVIPDSNLPLRMPILSSPGAFTETEPARLVYKVGLNEESEKAVDALYGTGNSLTFYTNEWDGGTGDAYSEYWPLASNPYYKTNRYDKSTLNKTQNTTGTKTMARNFDGSSNATYVKQGLGNNGKLTYTSPYMPVVETAKLYKVDKNGNKITANPATFAIYTDENCTKQVGTFNTSNGEITFTDTLRANKDYYIKETAAPTMFVPFSGAKLVRLSEDGDFIFTGTDSHISVDENGVLVVKNDLETTSKKVTKTWQNISSGNRPASVKMRLLADGDVVEDVNVSSSNNWSYTWQNLPKYSEEDFHVINYTVDEVGDFSDFVVTKSTNSGGDVTITNKKIGDVDVSVLKKWEGGERSSVTVELYRDNVATGQKATLTADTDWYYMWENLPEGDNTGHMYTYSVKEEDVAGFTKDEHKWTGTGDPYGQTIVQSGSAQWETASSLTRNTTYMIVYKSGNKYYALYAKARDAVDVKEIDIDVFDDPDYEPDDIYLWTAGGNNSAYKTLKSVGYSTNSSSRYLAQTDSRTAVDVSSSSTNWGYNSTNHLLYYYRDSSRFYYYTGGSSLNSSQNSTTGAVETYLYTFVDTRKTTAVEDSCVKGDTHYIIKNTKIPVEGDDPVDVPVIKKWAANVGLSKRQTVFATVYEQSGNSYINPKYVTLTANGNWQSVVKNLDPNKTYYLVEDNDTGAYVVTYEGGETANITVGGKTVEAVKIEPRTVGEIVINNAVIDVGVPAHSKKIDSFRDGEDNPDTDLDNNKRGTEELDDLYRLYLNVGPENTYNDLDVAFIIDRSTSMSQDYSQWGTGENGQDATDILGGSPVWRRDALDSMLNGIGTPKEANSTKIYPNGLISNIMELNPNNKIAVGWFAGTAGEVYDWTSTITAVKDHQSISGTNYVAAIAKAEDFFDDDSIKNDGHEKILIFISDGEPTSYTYNDRVYNDQQWSSSANLRNYTNGAVDSFKENYPDVRVYTVGVGNFDTQVLDALATSGETIEGTDFRAILNILDEEISGGTGRYTALRVHDTLSENVDFYTDDLDLLVKKTDENGENAVILYQNGQMTEEGLKYLKPDGVSVNYTDKSVTMDFRDDYYQEGFCIFSMSFNVKATQTAYDTYANNVKTGGLGNGYGGLSGDPATDFGTNTTSSEKPGLFSNGTALFEYANYHTGETGETKTVFFDAPVIQVDVMEIPVSKVWSDGNENHEDEPITVQLKMDGTVIATAALNSTNDWEYTFEDVPVGHEYSVEETSVPAGYMVNYYEDGDGGFIVSNAKRGTVDIEKVWNGDIGDSVTFRIYSMSGGAAAPLLDENGNPYTVTLTANDDWSGSIFRVPVPVEGVTYYLVEDRVDGFVAVYDNSEMIPVDGEYVHAARLTFDSNARAGAVVTNMAGKILPSTGGIGIDKIYIAGAAVLLATLFGYCYIRRKERKAK